MAPQLSHRNIRSSGEVSEQCALDPNRIECLFDLVSPGRRLLEMLGMLVIQQSKLKRSTTQSLRSVVRAKPQAVLGSAGEHAIGLTRIFGDQVVHHHADVRLIPAQPNGLLLQDPTGRIQPSHQPLAPRFLVSSCAVDLTGQEQSGKTLRFTGGVDLPRRNHVVFHGITGLQNLRMFASRQSPDHLLLDVERQGGADAIGIHRVGPQTFRL